MVMPAETIFRTVRIAALIGLVMGLRHMVTQEDKNFIAMSVVFVAFLLVFGLDLGFRRWAVLFSVAACAYLACFHATDLPLLWATLMARAKTGPRPPTAPPTVKVPTTKCQEAETAPCLDKTSL